jgi:hypothetical protein
MQWAEDGMQEYVYEDKDQRIGVVMDAYNFLLACLTQSPAFRQITLVGRAVNRSQHSARPAAMSVS